MAGGVVDVELRTIKLVCDTEERVVATTGPGLPNVVCITGEKEGVAAVVGVLKSQPHATLVPEHVHRPGSQKPDLLVND